MPSYFQDETFLDVLVGLICRDQTALNILFPIISAKDFQPIAGQEYGEKRWLVATLALEYYEKYREPVGDLLRAEIIDYSSKAKLGPRQQKALDEYAQETLKKKLVGAASVVQKVEDFKRERLKAEAVQELITLQSAGELTDDRWWDVCRKAIDIHTHVGQSSYYFDELQERLMRRIRHKDRRPLLLIPPLDNIVQAIGRKEFGLVLAPYKRGKSMFLLWLALAYCVQRLNVLYITLEDPKDEVELRLDEATTMLKSETIYDVHKAKLVEKRFTRFRRLISSRLVVYDGTDEAMTVASIDALIDREREKGFIPDVIIVDYDDEIRPVKKLAERRFEFAEVYSALRRMASRRNALVWTAAQTRRDTEKMKTLSASTLAEDISKVRKATMALSLGAGDWGPESVYLWVAAHKIDKQHVGCNVMTDRSRALMYDHERTRAKMKELGI